VTARLAPLARFLLWDYDRGSVPYDVLVAVMLLLLIVVPAVWWGDPMVAGR
jgi:hypothetical protein